MTGKLASVRRSVSGAAGVFGFSSETADRASQMPPTATAINAADRNWVDDMVMNSSPVDHRWLTTKLTGRRSATFDFRCRTQPPLAWSDWLSHATARLPELRQILTFGDS